MEAFLSALLDQGHLLSVGLAIALVIQYKERVADKTYYRDYNAQRDKETGARLTALANAFKSLQGRLDQIGDVLEGIRTKLDRNR